MTQLDQVPSDTELRWPTARPLALDRFAAIADVLDEHARRLFAAAMLWGISMQLTGITSVFVFNDADAPARFVVIAVIALNVLVALFCYRRQAFSAVRRRPWLVVPLSLFCTAVMIADPPMYQGSYYDIAFIPLIFACFTGWRMWAIPAMGIPVIAYLAMFVFHDLGQPDLPEEVYWFTVIDVFEFVVLALLTASFSGVFSRTVAQIISAPRSKDPTAVADDDTGDTFLTRLSPREMEIALHIANGKSNDEIAQQLHLSRRTVETHVAAARKKADCATRTALAVRVAIEADGGASPALAEWTTDERLAAAIDRGNKARRLGH